jgi:hypothetical protein
MAPTPRPVAWSVRLYRLLLAAYPRPFRRAYGEPMAQLFRDTALAAYRRRGLLGLATGWWVTAGDWAVSAVRQHWEEALRWSGPEAAAAAEVGVSARNVVRGWALLGWSALATAWLSARFALQIGRFLVLRRTISTGAILLALAWAVTGWSYYSHGWLGLGDATSLKVSNGAVVVRHIYAHDEPVTGERWRTDPLYRGSLARTTPWDFHFSSGHYIGSGAPPGHVWPRRYWVLHFPLWLPPVLLLCWGVLRLFRGNTHSGGAISCGDLTSS